MDGGKTIKQVIEEYNKAMNDSNKYTVLVRDSKLQAIQIEELSKMKNEIKGYKYGAISAGDEQAANILFHLQCGLNAQKTFLKMWINIKKKKYYDAWDNLIDAEEYISIALKAANDSYGMTEFMERLKQVERVVFPGYNVYNSWGAIIRGGTCTVCRKLLDECMHMEGLVYWGKLCVRVNPEIVDIDHFAMVTEPRDRRCVVTQVTLDDGYYHDYMTQRKIKKVGAIPEGSLGYMKGRMFHNKLVEID